MRKRLFIFAAATCFALSAFATPAFAEDTNLEDGQTISSEASVQSNGNSNGNSDFAPPAFAEGPSLPDGQTINSEASVQSNENSNGNSNENTKEGAPPSSSDDAGPKEKSYSGEEQVNACVVDPCVAKIGGTEYSTLQEAITAACNGTASSDATITLQKDLELNNEGLRFIGSDDSNVPWKKITLNADNHSLTLNQKGIYATHCEVTIENCPALTVHAGKNPGNAHGESANISAVLFCPGTLTLDNCKTVNITNVEPITQGGSGLCIYNGGNLCIQNYTNFTVSGFMSGTPGPGEEGQGGCSGIYIDSDKNINHDYETITGKIDVSNNSTLTATKCYHNGITANPVNVNVTNNSKINVCQNGDARNPRYHKGGIGSYYGTMTISENSSVISEDNGAQFGIFVHNLNVDGTSEIKSQYDTIYGIAFDGDAVLQSGAKMTSVGHCGPGIALYYGTASLTVHENAVLSSSNTAVGLANGGSNFKVLPGAYVYLNDNFVGLDNYPKATTTVEADAHLEICRNGARGIKNGNGGIGPGTLVLNAGLITENNKLDSIPYKGNLSFDVGDFYDHENYGGGIYNEYGNVNLSPLVKVYNNKAVKAGDDLYNVDKEGNSFTINQLEPGAKGEILSDDQQIIDDWYTDYEGTDRRWSPDNAINNTDIILPRGAALKAAHGKAAPLPKPEEPTAAPTTAPANNTATATPAPTAQPAATATPTPTPAAAPSAIPQTGDTLPLVPLGLAALGSITALCVLQKRRKSKS